MAACVTGSILSYTAQAQSSGVTLYGLLDEGITYVSNVNGHSQVRLQDYYASASRIGFRGRENLGRDTAAIFQLETGLNINNGTVRQGGALFGRGAWVGITNGTLGTLTAGRDFDRMTMIVGVFHPNAFIALDGATPGDADRTLGEFTNNTLVYTSPKVLGLQASAQYSLAEDGTSTTSKGPLLSGGLSFGQGPFSAGAAFTRIQRANFAPGASMGLREAFGIPVTPTTLFEVDTLRTFALGASYQMSAVRISAMYSNTRWELTTGSSETMHAGGASVSYQFTTAVYTNVGYLHSAMGDSSWDIYSANVGYTFSKRTDVYASAIFEKVSGPNVVAQLALQAASAIQNQLALRVALRHRF